ncbi:hypothetical protein CDIK_1606 [Cucumispora dikerogammari]|nr:hypothetical protein CDIK_1606 [Cucumispora dikerogammari]
MLKYIIQTKNTILCLDSKSPLVIDAPSLIFGETIGSRSLDGKTYIPKNICFIETIIDLKELYNTEFLTYNTTNVRKTVKILYVDTKGNTTASTNTLVFQKAKIGNLEAVFKLPISTRTSTELLLSLRSENPNLENPLLKFLADRPGTIFKLSFIFPGLPQNSLMSDLKNIIKDLAEEIQPLNELLQDKLFKSLKEITKNYNDIRVNCQEESPRVKEKDEKISNVLDTFNSKIKKINDSKYLHENLKLSLTIFLTFINFSYSQTADSLTNETFEQLKFEAFRFPIKQFIKQHVRNKIWTLDISVPHKRRISKLFNAAIDDPTPRNLSFLDKTISNLNEKIEDATRFVTFETRLYTLNREKNGLIEICGNDLKRSASSTGTNKGAKKRKS